MLNIGIVGVSGYAGEELLKILLEHRQVKISHLCAKIERDTSIASIFPWILNKLDMTCSSTVNVEDIAGDTDYVFLALPHCVSMEYAPRFLKLGKKVIDLSADYRIKDVGVYEKWYKTVHIDSANIEKSIYGLSELNFTKIKDAALVANPGCYPTAALLALAPVVKNNLNAGKIIIDAKSGASGAGRALVASLLFSEVNEDLKAYKINVHQHKPEIIQELAALSSGKVKNIIFVPHLVPMNRGILSTIYLELKSASTTADLIKSYRDFYKGKKFVRIYEQGQNPQVKNVAHTNFCDIGINVCGKELIIVSAIDNLVKGAAGQAVQNMNIMAGLKETEGLL